MKKMETDLSALSEINRENITAPAIRDKSVSPIISIVKFTINPFS